MIKWFKQYGAIGRNAFVVTLGSPFSLILLLSMLAFQALLACLPFFSFGEQLRLIRDQSLALCLMGGCLACALGAGMVLAEDIRRGAAPVVLSRPIGSFCFIAGTWSGLLGSVLVIHLTASVGCLWLTQITASEFHLDVPQLSQFVGVLLVVLVGMGLKHYFFGGSFVWQTNVALSLGFLVVFLANAFHLTGPLADTAAHPVDWKTAQGCLTVFFALVTFSSIMTFLAVLADVGLLLGLAVVVFFGGLLAEYVIRSLAAAPWLTTVLRSLVPNWQLFWVNDRLAEGLAVSPAYLLHSALHAFLYAAAVLIMATLAFQSRELESRV